MAYNLRGDGLRARSAKAARASADDVNPMANVANIVDAMLVLSLGLMVAIVMYWNVDLRNIQEMVKEDEITEVQDVNNLADEMTSAGSSYTELGKVYQDPNTGKLYMLTEDVDKGASSTGDEG